MGYAESLRKIFALIRIASFPACAALLLPACFAPYGKPYPRDWPALQPIKENLCSHLSGTYNDLGAFSEEAYIFVSLTQLLLDQPIKIEEGAVSDITIAFSGNDLLTISSWKSDQLIGKKTYTREDPYEWACDDDGAVIYLGQKTEFMLLGMSSTTKRIMLNKRSDNYLVAKIRETGVALLFYVLPVGGGKEEWYQFSPFTQNGVPLKN